MAGDKSDVVTGRKLLQEQKSCRSLSISREPAGHQRGSGKVCECGLLNFIENKSDGKEARTLIAKLPGAEDVMQFAGASSGLLAAASWAD